MRKWKLWIIVVVAMMLVLAGCEDATPTVSPLATPDALAGGAQPPISQTQEEGGMDFSDAIVNGIPLVVLIIGLVQFISEMGVSGKPLRALSAGIGLILGVLYQVSLGAPGDFAAWFAVVIYGLGLGVTASGLVDVARDLAQRFKAV